MHTDSRVRRRRVSLGLVAITALAGATLLNGAAAIGAPDDYGNIDVTAPGSITIHKHEYQTTTPAPEGAPDGSVGVASDPIAGVEFTAYPIVGIDLSDSADWDALSGLTPGAGACAAPAGYQLGAAIVAPLTAGDGTATVDVPVGAYLVCETDAPASVVERAQPFIVTVPLPYQKGWLYDVHVYPKNGTAGITKTIEAQEGLGLGSAIRFPVTTDVPVLGAERLLSYVVTDALDPRLSPDPAAAAGIGVAQVRVEGGGAIDPSYFDVVAAGQTIRVVFTPAGLTWLEGQDGIRVVTTFQGLVTGIGDGAITNEALLFVNDPGLTTPTGISPTVTTYWGDARLLKTDDTDEANPLAGAVFEVYAAADPYATDCSTAVAGGSALVVDGATRFTSDADGVVSIGGLFVSDSVNAPVRSTQRCYVIREVQAPAGFVTPTGAAGDRGIRVAVGSTATGTYQAEIQNTQQDVPDLPLTGANGQLAMTIAGGALVLVAIGAVLVSRRRARVRD